MLRLLVRWWQNGGRLLVLQEGGVGENVMI